MTDSDHRFRRLMAIMVGVLAAALAAYATYLAVTLPAGLQIPVSFARPGRARATELGVWALYVLPMLLVVAAVYFWRSTAWLLPGPSKDRRFTLGLIWMLLVGATLAEILLFSEAITAAASL